MAEFAKIDIDVGLGKSLASQWSLRCTQGSGTATPLASGAYMGAESTPRWWAGTRPLRSAWSLSRAGHGLCWVQRRSRRVFGGGSRRMWWCSGFGWERLSMRDGRSCGVCMSRCASGPQLSCMREGFVRGLVNVEIEVDAHQEFFFYTNDFCKVYA